MNHNQKLIATYKVPLEHCDKHANDVYVVDLRSSVLQAILVPRYTRVIYQRIDNTNAVELHKADHVFVVARSADDARSRVVQMLKASLEQAEANRDYEQLAKFSSKQHTNDVSADALLRRIQALEAEQRRTAQTVNALENALLRFADVHQTLAGVLSEVIHSTLKQ